MFIARRCPPMWMVMRYFDDVPPPDSWYDQFRVSIRETLVEMGVWLPC